MGSRLKRDAGDYRLCLNEGSQLFLLFEMTFTSCVDDEMLLLVYQRLN